MAKTPPIHEQAAKEISEAVAKVETWQGTVNPQLRRPLDLALRHLTDAQSIITDIATAIANDEARQREAGTTQ